MASMMLCSKKFSVACLGVQYGNEKTMDYLSRPHTITIPPLQCTPSLRIHPSFPRIQECADSWVLSTARALIPNPTESTQDLLLQSGFSFLAASVMAHIDNERSCIWVAMYIAWISLLDDLTDDCHNTSVGDNSSAAEALLYVLESSLLQSPHAGIHASINNDLIVGKKSYNNAGRLNKLSDMVARVALDWWTSEFRPSTMTPSLAARLLGSFNKTIQAAKSQISRREMHITQDKSTFIVRRRDTGATLTFFVMLECCLGIELDEETLQSEVMRELHEAVVDHASWVNDLLSMRGEYAQGDLENIAAVLCMNEYPGDLQASVDQVSRMIAMRDDDFMRALKTAHDCNWLMAKPGMGPYLEGLANWLPANIHWAYTSARYHGVGMPPCDPNAPLTVHLQPPHVHIK